MLGRLIDQLLPTHVDCPSEAQSASYFVSHNPHLRNYSASSPWGSTLDLLRSTDLLLINLETAATTRDEKWPDKVFNYRMHPTNIECLKVAGVDYAGLANNHSLDFGEKGLAETVKVVREAGIAFAGAGDSQVEARSPAILYMADAYPQKASDSRSRRIRTIPMAGRASSSSIISPTNRLPTPASNPTSRERHTAHLRH